MLAARTAYDALADSYDERVAPSAWVRERLWQRLDELFPAGSRVLDATAGTGLDAAHLVERGVQVTACDLSPGMLARLSLRVPGIPIVEADLNELEACSFEGPFDGVLSTFAGINAAPDLRGFARGAARWLRPGGVLFLHVLNRFPVAELLGRYWLSLTSLGARDARAPREEEEKRSRQTELIPLGRIRPHGQAMAALQDALRGERTVTIAGVPVPHRLWTPRGLAKVLATDFAVRHVRGLAVVRSADTLSPVLDRLETRLSPLPLFRAAGTFFTLELVRR